MEDVIKFLNQAKEFIMTGASDKALDNINMALRECLDIKDVIEAIQNPIPPQESMLPLPGGGLVVNADHVTINFLKNEPAPVED